jgi:hypothetical protein
MELTISLSHRKCYFLISFAVAHLLTAAAIAADLQWKIVEKDYQHHRPKMLGSIEELWIDGKRTNTVRYKLEKHSTESHRWKSLVFTAKGDDRNQKDGRLDAETVTGDRFSCVFRDGKLDGLMSLSTHDGKKVSARFRDGKADLPPDKALTVAIADLGL